MTDRYDDGIDAVREMPVPDQWEEIRDRAATDRDQPILLDAERLTRRPRWPLLAAGAAAAAVIGITALVTRPDSAVVSTDEPAGRTATGPPATADGGTPPGRPSTSTPTTGAPSTTGPDAGTPGAGPPATGGDVPATGGRPGGDDVPIAGCRDLVLASQGAPSDIYPAQYPAEADDPRVPDAARPGLIGVFRSETNTQRAVFVVVGRGFGEGEGYLVEGPGPGRRSRIRPSSDGWVGEIDMTLNGKTCELSLLSIGLREDEMVRFVRGVGFAH